MCFWGVRNVRFSEIWRALLSCYHYFVIRFFALLPTGCTRILNPKSFLANDRWAISDELNEIIRITQIMLLVSIYPSEKIRKPLFFDVFREWSKNQVEWNGLTNKLSIINKLSFDITSDYLLRLPNIWTAFQECLYDQAYNSILRN